MSSSTVGTGSGCAAQMQFFILHNILCAAHTLSNALTQQYAVLLGFSLSFLFQLMFYFVCLPDTTDWLAGCVGWLFVWGSRVVFCSDQRRVERRRICLLGGVLLETDESQ